jgi:dTDP-4-dehydrorhamnose reductase
MILVTGASGLLGGNLVLAANERGLAVAGLAHHHEVRIPGVLTHRLDLTNTNLLEKLLRSLPLRWIVHGAALTNVDWCEDHPAEAHEINVAASGRLAGVARDVGARVLYVSTDAVFDGGGGGGYREEDEPNPVNVYARTKWLGERAVLEAAPDSLVVRTNLYGWNILDKASLAEWVLARLEAGEELPGFGNVVFSPLLANDLADVILELIERRATGVYHAGAADSCSKYDFARHLAQEFGLDAILVRRATLTAAGLRAPRPLNTSLDTGKLARELGRALPTVREGLRRFKGLRDRGFRERLKRMAGGGFSFMPQGR